MYVVGPGNVEIQDVLSWGLGNKVIEVWGNSTGKTTFAA